MAENQTIGRYRIVSELGHGAMGAVYRAEDPIMDRTVAIKTILAAALSGPLAAEYRERFIREAKAAGRLSHPGIVTVYDVSEENGTPYLVMEFVNGRSLAAAMDSGERFSIERIYDIGQQVADALGYAHRNGVVHRDVKPANILLAIPGPGEPERAKLADLGVAKLSATQITTTGQLLGTPAFMPPEQFTGVPIDGRADLFSLGVILYWMATGDKPFSGETITAVSYKIVHSEPVPPRKINPAVPVALERIIMKCLEKDPAARYMTGEALAADLAAGRAGRDLLQSGGVAPQPRSVVATVMAPVSQIDGDPNTTLDSDMRLQMQEAAAAHKPPKAHRPFELADFIKKLETNHVLGIAVAIAVLLVGSIATAGFIRHRREVRAAADEAQKEALAQQQELAAQQALAQAAQTDSALATTDQTSKQDEQTGGSGGTNSATTPVDAEKKAPPKTPPAKNQKKNSSAAPQQTLPTNSSSAPNNANNPPTVANPPVQPVVNPTPATATTNPPATSTPAQTSPAPAQQPQTAAPKPTAPAATAESAKLHIDDGQVPNAASFTVMMDGKELFTRKVVAEGSAPPKAEDLNIPPGEHEFRVVSGSGGVAVGDSSSVKDKFQSKKKVILKIELRDTTSGTTLKRNSHLDAGKAEFLISLRAANLLGF